MEDSGWTALRTALVGNYDELSRRLTRRLQSQELADEALQNTFLRITRGGAIGPVKNPFFYLLRIATNIALEAQRRNHLLLSAQQIEDVLDVADEGPSPSQSAEAKSELALVERALAKMSARQRANFLASFYEDLSSKELAHRFDISVRWVNRELETARALCEAERERISTK